MKLEDMELHPEEAEKVGGFDECPGGLLKDLDRKMAKALESQRALDVNSAKIDDRSIFASTAKANQVDDPIHHPKHYTHYKGLEVIQLTEQMNFNKGNAVKYVARAGIKDQSKEIEDLEKAKWYIQREIDRIQKATDVWVNGMTANRGGMRFGDKA